MAVYRLHNVIQPYAWGSTSAIAELQGRPTPSSTPEAELWMGTHPKGPSRVAMDGNLIPLQQLIDDNPEKILGAGVVARFGPQLPFLFKVLAAGTPLSIQAHPDKKQAQAGFDQENAAGKAMDAPDRNYRDPNHKPEIISALTPFWALNGFRTAGQAAHLLAPVCPSSLRPALAVLGNGTGAGLRHFFETIMTLPTNQRETVASEVATRADALAGTDAVYDWMVELAAAYPADMGLLAPALLNLICLEPGQAMFLPAGQLHAYLKGTGIELMANSDNVLRGGLTPKHVDVPQLMQVVRFEGAQVNILETESRGNALWVYGCPAAEFSLSVIRCKDGQPYLATNRHSLEILLCTRGEGHLTTATGDAHALKKGDAVLVPAELSGYGIDGRLTLYRAAVPVC